MSSTAPAPDVLWLPPHPDEGAVSMDRYWRELDRVRRQREAAATAGTPGEPRIRCPLGQPPTDTRRAGRARRCWSKYVAYPALVRRQQRGANVVHVLDHAFARLLRVVRAATPTTTARRDGVFCVATVHDLAPLRDPGDLSPRQQARFRRNVECLRLADLLLADSRHTAAEVVAELGIPPERVRVLPMGVDLDRFSAVFSSTDGDDASITPSWARPLTGRRVILSVGSTEARKNLPLLPAIFRALRRPSPPQPPLALAFLRVGVPLPPGLRAEIGAAIGPDTPVVELGLAPERDLLTAYGRADALVFPSRLEGFGLPVLEAMAAGCPVVCSDASSLPEVGGEAALYFAPDDPVAAAAHLRRLLTDEAFRRERVALGRVRAAGFGWETHYDVLTQIYRQCLRHPSFHVG